MRTSRIVVKAFAIGAVLQLIARRIGYFDHGSRVGRIGQDQY
jgi:hypothetical protein